MAEINPNVVVSKENTVQFADSINPEVVNVTPHQRSFNDFSKSWLESLGEGSSTQTVETMLSRPGLIGKFDWLETQVGGTKVATYTLPSSIASTNFKTSKLKYFKYLRTNFVIRVVLNGTRFHKGRLLVVWAPGSAADDTSSLNETSLASLICFPSIILDPSTNQSGEIDIPFISPYLFYPLTPVYGTGTAAGMTGDTLGKLGSVQIYILNGLTTSNSTTTPVSVAVYGWFRDVKLSVPVYAQMGVVSDIIEGSVAPMTEIVNDATAAVSSVTRMLSSVGLSKPSVVNVNTRVTPVIANSMSYGVGGDVIEKLTIDPKCALEPCNELFGTKDDEMDIVYIGKTWSLNGQFAWTTSNTPDTILARVSLYPTVSSSAGWLLRAFKYYRGSVRVRLQFVASQFLTGRVAAVFVPSGSGIPTTEPITAVTDEMYNQVYDLTGTAESEFTIPYNAPFPVLPTAHFANTSSAEYVGIPYYEIGHIWLYVVNQLRSVKTATDTATINVYVSFDDDFEVYWPTLSAITGDVSSVARSFDELVFAGTTADNSVRYQFPTLAASTRVVDPYAIADAQNGIIEEARRATVQSHYASKKEVKEEPIAEKEDGEESTIEKEIKNAILDSEVIPQAGVYSTTSNPPVQNSRISSMPAPLWTIPKDRGFAAEFNFGERITNLRQVLKRYSASYYTASHYFTPSDVPNGSTSIIGQMTFAIGAGPIADLGIASGATSSTANRADIAISCWTFLSYFGCMYRYQRGGVRMKFIMGQIPSMTVTASPGMPLRMSSSNTVAINPFLVAPSPVYVGIFPATTSTTPAQYIASAFDGRKALAFLSEGCVINSGDINPTLEVEIPYYSPFMVLPTPSFSSSVADYTNLRPSAVASFNNLLMNRTITLSFIHGRITIHEVEPSNYVDEAYAPAIPNILVMESVADDFQFGFLTGAPVLQSAVTPV